MRRLSILAMMVAALLLVAGTASAQSKPNFTGTWTLVPDPNAAPPAGGGGGAGGRGGGGGRGGRGGAVSGPEVKITQDATTLKVERTQGQNTVTMSYILGGEGKNEMAGRQGGPATEIPYKTAWEGAKLVITTTTTMQGADGNPMTMSSKQALSIAADGTLLVENTSTPMGATEAVTTKVTYKKG